MAGRGTRRRVTADRAHRDLADRMRRAGFLAADEEAALLLGQSREAGDVEGLLARRLAGEPLEHVLGWAEFCGGKLEVGPGVFVPRRRTEPVARLAAELADPGDIVVDLCCGCGALGVVVATACPGVRLYAVDVDETAVRYARRNLAPLGGTVLAGDLYDALPRSLRGRVDLLVANAPYVPSPALATMPREARLFEPRLALDGGTDGLDLHRRIAAGAGVWLRPGGRMVLETSRPQAQASVAIVSAAGLAAELRVRGEAVVVQAAAPTRDSTRTA